METITDEDIRRMTPDQIRRIERMRDFAEHGAGRPPFWVWASSIGFGVALTAAMFALPPVVVIVGIIVLPLVLTATR